MGDRRIGERRDAPPSRPLRTGPSVERYLLRVILAHPAYLEMAAEADVGPATFDDERSILQGKFGETTLSLDLHRSAPASYTAADLHAVDGIDTMTMASTNFDGDKETSLDRRLATAIGLSGLITLAGLSQLAGRSSNGGPSPNVTWRSEA